MHQYTKIILAGGTGLIGNALVNYFKPLAKEIIILSRNPQPPKGNIRTIAWDGMHAGFWCAELEGAEIIINLTGKNINCRWTEENKSIILSSRVNAIHALANAIKGLDAEPKLWIQFSSVGTYASTVGVEMTEDGQVQTDTFLGAVVNQWESAYNQATAPYLQMRKVILRTSLVLSKNGGIFPVFKRLLFAGLGGTIGSGEQYVSWVHESDLVRIIEWIVKRPELSGPINCTAPHPVPNKEFMQAFRQIRGVWIGLPIPTFALKWGRMITGKDPELLLQSTRAIPFKLTNAGFQFLFHKIKPALFHLFERKPLLKKQ